MTKPIRWIMVFLIILGSASLSCQLVSGGEEPTSEPIADSSGVAEDSAEPVAEEAVQEDASSTSATDDVAVTAGDDPTQEPPPTPETAADEGEADSEAVDTGTDSGAASDPSSDSPEAADDEDISQVLGDFELSTIAQELDFDSYRFNLVLDFIGTNSSGEESNQHVSGETVYVEDPFAMSMEWDIEGIGESIEVNRIVMTQIEETTYLVVPEFGCVTSSAVDNDFFADNPFASLLDPGELVGDLEGPERVGEEMVNGIPTIVYAFDKEFTEDNDLEWAEGRIYIAKEGRFVVRLVIDGEGAMNLSEEAAAKTGTFHLEFDISDINQPIEVAIPIECEGVGADDLDVPILDDAYEVNSFAGVVSYQSNSTFEDAMTFYESALVAEGWTKSEEESIIMEGTAILTYFKENESLSLTIGDEAENDAIYVLIMTE